MRALFLKHYSGHSAVGRLLFRGKLMTTRAPGVHPDRALQSAVRRDDSALTPQTSQPLIRSPTLPSSTTLPILLTLLNQARLSLQPAKILAICRSLATFWTSKIPEQNSQNIANESTPKLDHQLTEELGEILKEYNRSLEICRDESKLSLHVQKQIAPFVFELHAILSHLCSDHGEYARANFNNVGFLVDSILVCWTIYRPDNPLLRNPLITRKVERMSLMALREMARYHIGREEPVKAWEYLMEVSKVVHLISAHGGHWRREVELSRDPDFWRGTFEDLAVLSSKAFAPLNPILKEGSPRLPDDTTVIPLAHVFSMVSPRTLYLVEVFTRNLRLKNVAQGRKTVLDALRAYLERDATLKTALIRILMDACSRVEDLTFLQEILELFLQPKVFSRVTPDDLCLILQACARLNQFALVGRVFKAALVNEIKVSAEGYAVLVDTLLTRAQFKEAEKILNYADGQRLHGIELCYERLLQGYQRELDFESMAKVVSKMIVGSFGTVSTGALVSILSACASHPSKDAQLIGEYFTAIALTKPTAEISKKIQDAILLQYAGVRPDFDQAAEVYERLKANGYFDSESFVLLLLSCRAGGSKNASDRLFVVIQWMRECEVELGPEHLAAVIGILTDHVDMETTLLIIRDLGVEPDWVCVYEILRGFCLSGVVDPALELLAQLATTTPPCTSEMDIYRPAPSIANAQALVLAASIQARSHEHISNVVNNLVGCPLPSDADAFFRSLLSVPRQPIGLLLDTLELLRREIITRAEASEPREQFLRRSAYVIGRASDTFFEFRRNTTIQKTKPLLVFASFENSLLEETKFLCL